VPLVGIALTVPFWLRMRLSRRAQKGPGNEKVAIGSVLTGAALFAAAFTFAVMMLR
jgi:hypothetical protein